jgi:adenosylcobyric acid synthase
MLGKTIGNRNATVRPAGREQLYQAASRACDRLRRMHGTVVIEGAGSCAEVNLLADDYINFTMAAYADAPVVLVADIDRGGVFAQIVGTLACLPPEHQLRIGGFIINRFRGDLDLFQDGVRWLEQKTGKPVFGTVPWFDHIHIEPEDAVAIENPAKIRLTGSSRPAIAVIRLPHISNFNDFEPLRRLAGIEVHYLEQLQELAPFRAVIVPGSKNTR